MQQKKSNHVFAPIESMVPCNLNTEKAVLGALMNDSDVYYLVSNILISDDFYNSENKQIFEAIKELNCKDKPVDILTVTETLKKNTKKKDWAAMLVDITKFIFTSSNVEYHARLLHQLGIKRRLRELCTTVQSLATDPSSDVDEIDEFAFSEYCNIFDVKEPHGIDSVVMEAQEILIKAAQDDSGITGVPSGINDIDRVISGFQNGDLILVGGRPAMGKTSLMISMAKNIAVDYNIPVALFSLECDTQKLVNKIEANVLTIPAHQIIDGKMDADEWQRYDKNIEKVRNAPLYIDDTPSLDISKLRSRLFRLVKEKGVKIAFIDFIQLLTIDNRKWNTAMDLSLIIRGIKGLARELDIPIVVISQLHRAEKEGSDRQYGDSPRTTDFSGFNEMAIYADTVMLLHRPEYYGNNEKIYKDKVLVKLHGNYYADKTLFLDFDGRYCRISDEVFDKKTDDNGEFMSSKLVLDPDDPFGVMS